MAIPFFHSTQSRKTGCNECNQRDRQTDSTFTRPNLERLGVTGRSTNLVRAGILERENANLIKLKSNCPDRQPTNEPQSLAQ